MNPRPRPRLQAIKPNLSEPLQTFKARNLMPDTKTSFDRLRLAVQQTPGLQDRLFAIQNAEELIAELARLSVEIGDAVSEEDLMGVRQQGRRGWIERDLPC
jgi:hypothetical protein